MHKTQLIAELSNGLGADFEFGFSEIASKVCALMQCISSLNVHELMGWVFYEGDIGFFGFAVLVTFEIGFSVFALKIPGFSVLVSTAVFGFSFFDIRVSVFMNKKAVIRFLRAIHALYEPF